MSLHSRVKCKIVICHELRRVVFHVASGHLICPEGAIREALNILPDVSVIRVVDSGKLVDEFTHRYDESWRIKMNLDRKNVHEQIREIPVTE